MKLYYLQGACSLAIHIVLEWIGEPYESESIARTELKSERFLNLNPAGSVPVLSDNDLVLTQSTAILQYLGEKYPHADLVGTDLRSHAETRRWLGVVNSDVHRVFGLIFGWKNYVDEGCKDELIAGAKTQLDRYFVILDKQLQNKDYLTGTRSVADAYLWVTLRWAHLVQVDLSPYPELRRFYEQLALDSGVQAALKQEGL
ncbi:glutathione S-transferase family protein [Paenalcaligenes hominis]|uniref:glutathione S-transferase family protein n=1 Tax=Paenalcaligenes hominis TaxID=643674 RepID=UPI0035247976